jgi:hypothetical protein
MKTHEAPRANGSIRMQPNHVVSRNNNNSKPMLQHKKENVSPKPQLKIQREQIRPSIEIEECNLIDREELKFIDTTSYCETPKLSNADQRDVKISIENIALQTPGLLNAESDSNLQTSITSLAGNEEKQLNLINGESVNVGTNKQSNTNDVGVDSAVEDSTISLEQVMTHVMMMILCFSLLYPVLTHV